MSTGFTIRAIRGHHSHPVKRPRTTEDAPAYAVGVRMSTGVTRVVTLGYHSHAAKMTRPKGCSAGICDE